MATLKHWSNWRWQAWVKWQQPDLFAVLHVAFSSCLKILALEPLEAVESSKAQRCFFG
jgi:hypothetical protein